MPCYGYDECSYCGLPVCPDFPRQKWTKRPPYLNDAPYEWAIHNMSILKVYEKLTWLNQAVVLNETNEVVAELGEDYHGLVGHYYRKGTNDKNREQHPDCHIYVYPLGRVFHSWCAQFAGLEKPSKTISIVEKWHHQSNPYDHFQEENAMWLMEDPEVNPQNLCHLLSLSPDAHAIYRRKRGNATVSKLVRAAKRGDLHGAKAAIQTEPGHVDCAFRYACAGGFLPLVAFFVEECGVDVHAKEWYEYAEMPLLLASEAGHADVVNYLIEKGGRHKVWGAAHLAIKGNHLSVLQYFCEHRLVLPENIFMRWVRHYNNETVIAYIESWKHAFNEI